jgi:hypothetical protein
VLDILLTITALAALVTATSALQRLHWHDRWLLDHNLELGALRERAGITEQDIEDYHDRIHPARAETGGR